MQGVTGFYVNYGDAIAVRHYVEEIMSDPERRNAMGESARVYAIVNFSQDAFRRSILGILRAVVKP